MSAELPPVETVPALLAAPAARHPARTAVVDELGAMSYGEVDAAARRLAAGLIARGVEAGERLAVWLPNGADWLIAHRAAAACGAVVVPIDSRYRPAEVHALLAQCDAVALLLADRWRDVDFLAMLDELRERGLPSLRLAAVRRRSRRPLPAGATSWRRLMAAAGTARSAEVERRSAAVGPDDVHLIQFTSGSTGRPRGAQLRHAGLVRSALHHAAAWRLDGAAVVIPNPFSHILGLTYGALVPSAAAGAVVTLSRFAPRPILDLIARHRPAAISGAPSHYRMLVDALGPHDDVTSLRLGMVGGAALTPKGVAEVMERLGLVALLSGYGMSETGSIAATEPGDEPAVHATTVGRPLPWWEVKVVDPETGIELPPWAVGELWIRGPAAMVGYVGNPEDSRRVLRPDGWLATGDLLALGSDGRLRFYGRRGDRISVGGYEVYPLEVERRLIAHPAVAEARVVAVPDRRLGEVPFAFLRALPGAELRTAEVAERCARQLASFKVPRHFHVVDRLPALPSGKVDVEALRRLARRLAGT